MAQTLRARASSLGASALLLGSAVLLAVNAKVTMVLPDFIDPPPIFSETFPEPPKPPPPVRNDPPPPTSGPTVIDTFRTPIATIGDDAETPTLLPFGVGAGPVQITDPRWSRVPSDLERFYPRRPLERGIEGRAVLDCAVSTTGALSCSVVSETPESMGFGEAALRISREYSMVPAMVDGRPAPGRYRMVVPFTLR